MSSASAAVRAPREVVPSGVLGMALFIATEAMFFIALISAYLVLRAGALQWPPPEQPRLPLLVTGFNTAILLVSAWTIRRALLGLRRADGSLVGWMALTALLGTLFVGIQGYEWVRLVSFGLTTTSSIYGATFYTLVGAHGLHVICAVVALLFYVGRAAAGQFAAGDEDRLTPMLMYWLFVVAVWPILYLLVYLQ